MQSDDDTAATVQQRPAETRVDVALEESLDRRGMATARPVVSSFGAQHTVYVPQLVATQAHKTPNALAIATEASTLSYGQLYERAAQLAQLLLAQGIGHGSTVGVCTGRSSTLAVGLLGSLLAGATYLPLDPTNPPDRLAFMVADANASLVLTSAEASRRAADLIGNHNIPLLDLDALDALDHDAQGFASQASADLNLSPSGDDIAYIIYTSGSTGQPKGVEITHDNVLNLVRWHRRAFAVSANDRASHVSSPAFDAAGWELWPYLAAGASVHFVDEDTRSNPRALRDWLVSRRITLSFAPTPLAEQLLDLEWPAATPLRALLTGADTLRTWPRAGLPFTLVNNYGPSECTVVATSAAVPPSGHSSALPAIGFPIDGVEITIRDDELRPLPPGEMGEICISGQSVGRGYRNRSELTARIFVPDSSSATGHFYRTGDRGRVLPDGQIDFLGRIDDQIKLRGYRIEPGEIVAALCQHPDVLTSAVLAHAQTSDTAQLVAYVTLRQDATLDPTQLHAFLSTRLPDYMLPAVFVHLDALPLSASGKVDRSALPSPSAANILRQREAQEAASEAAGASSPLSLIESRVASLVEDLLHLGGCGLDDNFFLLGGHSLLGAQLVVRLGEMFGVECSLRTLFEAPTIRQLSQAIERLILAKLDALDAAGALDQLEGDAQRQGEDRAEEAVQ